MKYTASLLLFLFSLTAASVLHQQENNDVRTHFNRHRNRNNIDDLSNESQGHQGVQTPSYRRKIRINDDLNSNLRNKWSSSSEESNEKRNKWNSESNSSSNESNEQRNKWSSSSEESNEKRNKWNSKESESNSSSNESNGRKNKHTNNNDKHINIHDKGMLKQKQKVILQLLSNLQQKNTNMKLAKLGDEFNPVKNINRFHNKGAVIKFLKTLQNNELLPKNEVFSPTNQLHQNQAAQLFTFLYSAQDWNTLKQAAAWARDRVNTDKFAYVLTAVVLNHPTTQGVVVPALYEILPHAFVPATIMKDLYKAKLLGIKQLTVRATYNNENRNNRNYNKGTTILDENDVTINGGRNNDRKTNKIIKRVIGAHNPNKLFADNDGSQDNKAGNIENLENRLSYFTEDVGVNDLHARFHMQYPIFLGVNNNKNYYTSNVEDINKVNINKHNLDVKRGEAFYFQHQQLYARYVLERLSNNLPLPLPINLDGKIDTGYNPNLQNANGKAVPARPANTKLQVTKIDNNNNNNDLVPNNNQAENPKVLERRLMQVAESGVVLNKDGTKTKLNKHNGVGVLANLIAAPASSLNPDYYGDYFSTAKNVIGNVVDPNNQNGVAPGVVSNYLTAARDPAYYQLLAKLNKIFKSLQNKLGPYTKAQLTFPGVKIERVDVSNLVTYLDTTVINVDHALLVNKRTLRNNEDMNGSRDITENDSAKGDYNVKLQRLTNKPFDIKLIVLSDKTTDAIVRVFLGPKYDSNGQLFTLAQASQFFIQLDQFKVKLNKGKNTIHKNSMNTNVNVHNPATMNKLWKRIEQGHLVVKKAEHQVLGLPLRSQLPKGKEGGQEFILYTIINKINDNEMDNLNSGSDEDNISSSSLSSSSSSVSSSSSEEIRRSFNSKRNSNERVRDNVRNDDGTKNLNNKIIRKVRDNRSIGFPLDRPVVDVNYNTANQYFKTVTIHHKVKNN